MTARLRYQLNKGKTPKETQSRPLTTSQVLEKSGEWASYVR